MERSGNNAEPISSMNDLRMIDGDALVQCFMHTQLSMQEDANLAAATQRMKAKTVLYFPGYTAITPLPKSIGQPITVVEDTTFHCAGKLVNEGHSAVLNFANPFTPGGGVLNGAMAQEEGLCRSSNLLHCVDHALPYSELL